MFVSAFFSSPLLWRLVGGFAVGTVLTFGLSAVGQPTPPPGGTMLELRS